MDASLQSLPSYSRREIAFLAQCEKVVHLDDLLLRRSMLAMLGRNDLALAELERMFAANDPLREFLYAIPQFEPLHGDPRFRTLLKQIGLPREPAVPAQ